MWKCLRQPGALKAGGMSNKMALQTGCTLCCMEITGLTKVHHTVSTKPRNAGPYISWVMTITNNILVILISKHVNNNGKKPAKHTQQDLDLEYKQETAVNARMQSVFITYENGIYWEVTQRKEGRAASWLASKIRVTVAGFYSDTAIDFLWKPGKVT